MSDLHPAAVLDAYLDICADKQNAIDQYLGLVAGMDNFEPVLDCAVGTGFGTLDLVKSGHRIVCSDGSTEMLKRFNLNSRAMGMDAQAILVKWEELGATFPGMFGLVMCRGNSLTYADSWDSGDGASLNMSRLRSHLNGMYRALRVGGRLFVDVPIVAAGGPSLQQLQHEGVTSRGERVHIFETIETVEETSRVWNVNMTIDSQAVSFRRESYLLSFDILSTLLVEVGFASVERCSTTNIRHHYESLLAVK